MKNIIITFIFISSIVFANDTLKYHAAIEYINNFKDSINIVFKNSVIDSTDLCIYVSNQIIPFSYSIFVDEIIEQEYSDSNESTIKKISDSLKYKSKELDRNKITYMELNSTFKNVKCELILFLGEIQDNKMIAEIVTKHKEYNDYNIIYDHGPVMMEFLFYFEEDKIKTVYSKILLL